MADRILIVDDERMIREPIGSYLESKGFEPIYADSGRAALELFRKHTICLVILDLMLPDLTGEEVCLEIRKTSEVPIIMLTAKTHEGALINGLAVGADDYMTKPFSLKELYARVQAVLRRTKKASPAPVFDDGRLVIDTAARSVTVDGRTAELTPIEWNILCTLVQSPNRVFTREMLISTAFDPDFDGYDRVIDTHIKNLRKKIETDSKEPAYILTVRGVGYRFGGKNEKS